MSIQRYDAGYRDMEADIMEPSDDGEWVTYADHVAAINVFSAYLLADDEHSYAAGFRNATEAMRAACISSVLAYADERLIKTKHPNLSEDITAALRVAAKRLEEVQP